MSTNPDIKRALGAVTCEPTEDSIKLYANDVDITNEIGGSSLPPVTAEDDGDLLGVVNGEWGKTDAPYTVEESMETIVPEQSVTTQVMSGMNVGQVVGSFDEVSAGTICIVTYNGTEYSIAASEVAGHLFLGETNGDYPDFSNYPFVILFANGSLLLYSLMVDPTLKVEKVGVEVVPSDNFKAAVAKSNVNSSLLITFSQRPGSSSAGDYVADIAFSDVVDAFSSGETIQARFLNSNGKTQRKVALLNASWNEYSSRYTFLSFISAYESQGYLVFEFFKYTSAGIGSYATFKISAT